jgi:glycosyltransferase involved in cell wall biosynthesis
MAIQHQWIVSQIGPRQNYILPRGFDAIGQFKRLYTDIWCPRSIHSAMLRGGKSMSALAAHSHPDVAPAKVVHCNMKAMLHAARRWRKPPTSVEARYLDDLHVGEAFDEFVCANLRRWAQLDPRTDAFIGASGGCLATMALLRQRGVLTVVDQTDPAKTQEEITVAEAAKWPGWEPPRQLVPQAYWDRLAAEWNRADRVLVNSQWSRAALIRQGAPPQKIVVVPPPYEPLAASAALPGPKDRPLTVLWLGSVVLRKGIQYLIEAAKLLRNTDLKFIVAGPIGITPQALATAPPNMDFPGEISAEQTNQLYRRADIFVLPTLSDGMAITQLEAMNRGLPVITTPNCGEVVTDGVDGLIVPPGNANALADAIARLNQDRELLNEMSQSAFLRSTQFLPSNRAREIEAAVRGAVIEPLTPARVAVVQDGSRLHYAVSLALHRAGALEVMFTEWLLKNSFFWRCVGAAVRATGSSALRGVLERRCDEIPASRVRINPSLLVRLRKGRSRYATSEAYYQWASQEVGNWVKRSSLDRANVLFGFIRNIDPALCRMCHERGILTVGDQIIAPSAVEAMEFRRQSERWPDWEQQSERPDFDLVEQVERASWAALDRITCASDYVRHGLVSQGVSDDKIDVIPYPIDASKYPVEPRDGRRGPLVVGFVGAVGLRKGAPYFHEVAKRLAGENLKFVMVGPILLTDAAARAMAPQVQLAGRVPRSQVANHLRQFDLFLFPSTCEGAAGAAMEAMAYGLPVIASPNAGSSVRDGIDGLIRNYDDVDGLAAAVQRLADDPALRLQMGREARKQAEALHLGWYGRRMLDVMETALRLRAK